MFTGIVQGLVTVSAVAQQRDISRLTLDMGDLAEGIQLGASVAVNGVCLTVTGKDDQEVNFDIIKETLDQTNLGALSESSQVNVERSFRVGDEVGGHVVSGHVSGVSRLLERRVDGHDHVLRFTLDPAWQAYVFHKGFIAVDGASLTVSGINATEGWFEISLIPETLARTTLGFIEVGQLINVEVEAQTVTTVETLKTLMADPVWISRLKEMLAAN